MERELIVELCRIKGSNREKIVQELEKQPDYAYVLGQLHMHRMAAAAYYVLKEHELLGMVNREFRSSIKTAYHYNQYKVDSYKKALALLAKMLESAEFPYAVLKGGVLASMYPTGVRTSNDIDLLILRQDIPKVVDCFRKQEFVQGFIRNERIVEADRRDIINAQLNRGEIIPFVKEVGLPGLEFLEIDINVSLDEKSSGDIEVISQMLGRRSMFQTEKDKPLYTLDGADFLIHLCVHLYKEAAVYQWVEMGRDLSIYKFLDVYLCYKNYMDEQDGDIILADRIRSYGLEMECFYALYYTGEIFDKELFQSILDKLGKREEYESRLDLVYNPVDKKYYRYKIGFLQRLFDGQRAEKLEDSGAAVSYADI